MMARNMYSISSNKYCEFVASCWSYIPHLYLTRTIYSFPYTHCTYLLNIRNCNPIPAFIPQFWLAYLVCFLQRKQVHFSDHHIYACLYISIFVCIRHCATNRKVPGSILGSAGFFSVASDSSMCPGVDSVSKNKYQVNPGGKSGRCVRLTTYHLHMPMSRNLGALISWKPVGLFRPVMGQLYVCMSFQCLKQLKDFQGNFLKHYNNGGHASNMFLNFLQPVITTWQTCEILRGKRQ
jgi:hypothetical protein